MGVLKIKTGISKDGKNIWEDIDDLTLTNLILTNLTLTNLSAGSAAVTGNLTVGANDGTSSITLNGKNLQAVIEDSAVTVYIHVNNNINNGNHYSSTGSNNTTYSSLMDWFNAAYPTSKPELRNKAIKGFLIEHRTINGSTYHLPYYWQTSKNAFGTDTSSWVLLNAIWG